MYTVTSTVGYLTIEARNHLERNGCIVTEQAFEHLTEDQLCDKIRGIDAVIANGEAYTSKVLHAADKLKIVARTGAGYDKVDIATASQRGIWVTTTPGANSRAVAEFTLALMLCLLRNIPTMAQEMKAGNWNQFTGREVGNAMGLHGAETAGNSGGVGPALGAESHRCVRAGAA